MARSKKSVNIPIEEIVASLDRLNTEGLELVVKAIQVILQERQPANDRIQLVRANKQTEHLDRIGIGANGSYGYIEFKFINGYGPYRYLRMRKNGIHHSFYLDKEIINDKPE